MREIEWTNQFKRDYKRESKRRGQKALDAHLVPILTGLANDQALAFRHCDHALIADWKNHRDCHIKPDLILIYQKMNDSILRLVRLGSHSELGL
jgi:mRNA interferase YafQ